MQSNSTDCNRFGIEYSYLLDNNFYKPELNEIFVEVITIAIRFASEIIKEIKEGGPIAASATSTNGEEYEKWLYEEDDVEPALMIKEKVISPNGQEKEYREFYGNS